MDFIFVYLIKIEWVIVELLMPNNLMNTDNYFQIANDFGVSLSAA